MLRDTYIRSSNIPARYLMDIQLKASKDDIETFRWLADYRTNIKEHVDNGDNLLICSNRCGNGKTTWATKLMLAYIDSVENKAFDNGCPALFINVNSFLNDKKSAISDHLVAEEVRDKERLIKSAKLVIFDDIADKSLSEYDLNYLYQWVDSRTANLKSCIFTSNQLPAQLEKTLNGKVFSRVVKYSDVKEITDGDHRGK